MSSQQKPRRFIRLPEVKAKVGLSRTRIYVLMKDGGFPHPIKLGARSIGWVEREVDEWIADRIRLSRPATAGVQD